MREEIIVEKIKGSIKPIVFLYGKNGETNDLFYYEGKLISLIDFLKENFKDVYKPIESFDAYYDYNNKDDGNQNVIQSKYRPVDESSVNIIECKNFLKGLCSGLLIIDISKQEDGLSKSRFLNRLPFLFTGGIGNNRLIIIGKQSDLDIIKGSSIAVENIEIDLPSVTTIKKYCKEKVNDKNIIDKVAESLLGKSFIEIENSVIGINKNGYDETCIESNKNKAKLKFDDIAGLQEAKTYIENTVLLPLQYKALYERLNRKAGECILFVGLPGTGKTMFGEAIANRLDAEFIYLKLSDLLSKWFGETEERIKEIFENAKKKSSISVIFLDEIDSLTISRDEDSATMTRIKSQLLTELSAIAENVLVIGATNRPRSIDSAFTRSQRFGMKIYIPLPDKEARKKIIDLNLKDINNNVNGRLFAEKTELFNGADMVRLCNIAKDSFAQRFIDKYGSVEKVNQNLEEICISDEDFDKAMESVHSTVTAKDVAYFKDWCGENGIKFIEEL